MYNKCYYELIEADKLPERYRLALVSFLEKVVALDPQCVILYGGFGRSKAKAGWSDIDLILVFDDVCSSLFIRIGTIKSEVTQLTAIELDINILPRHEMKCNGILSVSHRSKLINVFSGRANISLVLFGQIDSIPLVCKNEKQASAYMINEAIFQFRKELLSTHYLGLNGLSINTYIKKAFSVVRASLVILGYYVHPYEDLVDCLELHFPNFDTKLLRFLCGIRNGENKIDSVSALFIDIYDFLIEYLAFVDQYCREV